MLPLQIASEYVSIFMPFTQLMIIFTWIKMHKTKFLPSPQFLTKSVMWQI